MAFSFSIQKVEVMSNKAVFTIGSDPELFPKKNGKIVSVAGVLGCTKDQKLTLADDIRLQEDNVLAEFDINPCVGADQFNATMQRGLDLVGIELAKHGMEIADGVSSHIFTVDELNSFDKSAFVFGCTPDYNAFTGQQNPSPTSSNPGLRTAGGHIHIGYSEMFPVDSQSQMLAGVLCDYYLSLLSVVLDKDTRRKELYGKAGAIRYKDYGIEYRSLSNFWVADEKLRRMIYSQVEKVVGSMNMDHLMDLHGKLPVENLHSIINSNDVKQAEKFLARLNVA